MKYYEVQKDIQILMNPGGYIYIALSSVRQIITFILIFYEYYINLNSVRNKMEPFQSSILFLSTQQLADRPGDQQAVERFVFI